MFEVLYSTYSKPYVFYTACSILYNLYSILYIYYQTCALHGIPWILWSILCILYSILYIILYNDCFIFCICMLYVTCHMRTKVISAICVYVGSCFGWNIPDNKSPGNCFSIYLWRTVFLVFKKGQLKVIFRSLNVD